VTPSASSSKTFGSETDHATATVVGVAQIGRLMDTLTAATASERNKLQPLSTYSKRNKLQRSTSSERNKLQRGVTPSASSSKTFGSETDHATATVVGVAQIGRLMDTLTAATASERNKLQRGVTTRASRSKTSGSETDHATTTVVGVAQIGRLMGTLTAVTASHLPRNKLQRGVTPRA